MNLNNLFPSEKEKNEAVSQLTSLRDNPNWKFLVDVILATDIRDIEKHILGTYFDNPEEEKDLKKVRNYYIMLSQLPEKLIGALQTGKDTILDFDPYYKKADEIKKDKAR